MLLLLFFGCWGVWGVFECLGWSKGTRRLRLVFFVNAFWMWCFDPSGNEEKLRGFKRTWMQEVFDHGVEETRPEKYSRGVGFGM